MKTFILLIVLATRTFAADSCSDWFTQSKLVPGSEGCVLRCTTLKVDMSTFDCKEKCDQLCKRKASASSPNYSSVVDLAGLTKEEISLVLKSPREAKIVYEQMELAQSMTQKRFGRDWYDDESDAYRHFVWTGLLMKELGRENAQKFLDAHESANAPDDPSAVMDKKNNEIAMKSSNALQKLGKLNAEELDKEAIRAIEKSELKIIRKLGGPKK